MQILALWHAALIITRIYVKIYGKKTFFMIIVLIAVSYLILFSDQSNCKVDID